MKKNVFMSFIFITIFVLFFVNCASSGMKRPEALKKFNFTTIEQIVAIEEYPEYYFSKGPAQYLMTWEDQKIWKSIKKIQDLEKKNSVEKNFLKWFWQIRDPNPATVANEFKTAFYENAAYAQQKFTQEHLSRGWNSDRGKVLLMFGFPENQDFNRYRLVSIAQSDFEEINKRENEYSYVREEQTEQIQEWEYPSWLINLIDKNFDANHPLGSRAIYFCRGLSNGWKLAVAIWYQSYSEPLILPAQKYSPQYIIVLERVFEMFRNARIIDKNAKFVF